MRKQRLTKESGACPTCSSLRSQINELLEMREWEGLYRDTARRLTKLRLVTKEVLTMLEEGYPQGHPMSEKCKSEQLDGIILVLRQELGLKEPAEE